MQKLARAREGAEDIEKVWLVTREGRLQSDPVEGVDVMTDDLKCIADRLGFLPAAREDLRHRLHAAIDDGRVIPGGCDRNGLGEVERFLRGVAADPGSRHLMRASRGGGSGGSRPVPNYQPAPRTVEEIAGERHDPPEFRDDRAIVYHSDEELRRVAEGRDD